MPVFKTKDGKTIEVPDDAVVDAVVDGKTETVSALDALAGFSKGRGADKRFQEAAQMRKQGEAGLKIIDLLDRIDTDDDAFREFGRLMGLKDDDIEARLASVKASESGGEDADESEPTTHQTRTPKTPTSGGKGQAKPTMTKEQEAKLETAHKAAMETAREKAFQMMKEALDKDEKIGILDSGAKQRILDTVMAPAVISRLAQGAEFGPEVIGAALNDVRAAAKDFGILPDESKQANQTVEMLTKAGVNLGPSDSIGAAIQAGQPPKRVPVTDANYEDAFVARALMEFSEANKGAAPAKTK